MRTRSLLGVLASVAVIAGACSSSATPSPSSAAPASQAPASAPASQAAASGSAPASQAAAPSGPAPIASIGPGEGELDIVIWAGYAESGANVKEYDWVHPFEQANPDCAKVNAKTADTSDDMYTLMTQGHGQYDGVSASGDASNRLIEAGEIAPVDPSLFPDFKDLSDFLQSPPHNTVNGVHYGVSHGWGGNTLMYRTDKVNPAPISWSAVFDPTEAAKYPGKITDYGGTIYIADAALYLSDHQPSLGITDPYELTQPQFDAAIALLKAQHQYVGKYWTSYSDEIDNFTNGQSLLGTTWQYQTNALLASGVKVAAVVPSEGMTGWADTWMLSSTAKHPNCMLKWMAWMITPQVQAQVAEYFGEAPANPKACDILDKPGGAGSYSIPNFCQAYHVTDLNFYDKIAFWKTPSADCGDTRGKTCIPYDQWLQAWTDVKGG
ncbi:MAG: extracellular solute-binding protein [Candidatus Limnocylindrales bacterium]